MHDKNKSFREISVTNSKQSFIGCTSVGALLPYMEVGAWRDGSVLNQTNAMKIINIFYI